MFSWWQAIILGIVEGITEFLPISSTGHLILSSRLLNLPPSEFLTSFEITIQLGAILAIVALYWRSLLMNWEIIKRLIVAFIPTALIGLLLYKLIKNVLLGSTTVVLWSLLLGGIILIIFELLHKEKPQAVNEVGRISYRQSFIIGLFQSLAVIPGVSRAAATIIGGLLLGLRRKTIVEFSFLLAVPTMLAATGWDLIQSASSFSADQFGWLAVGLVVSFVTALVSVKWLLNYIQKNTFVAFGVYRIALAVFFWWLVIK
ncbi:MAG: undecaprenyl-diphosphate phosphatase [Patescibacteria group bacterium]